jgi:hypothetical protein
LAKINEMLQRVSGLVADFFTGPVCDSSDDLLVACAA